MLHKLTLGLYIITKRLGLCMPNIIYMNIIYEYAHIICNKIKTTYKKQNTHLHNKDNTD